MITRLTLTVFCGISLSGCATIISGGTDSVKLSTVPSGVEFDIKNENGKAIHHGTTPATVNLERGNGYFDGETYKIEFTPNGNQPKPHTLDSSLNGWYLGNLIFGGALGLLVIDPATGAMWDFPETVDIELDTAKPIK